MTAQLKKELSVATAAKLQDEVFRQKVIASSIELRELESRLKEAYVNKERSQQVKERQRHLQLLKEQTAEEVRQEEELLKLYRCLEEENARQRAEQKRKYLHLLQEQIWEGEEARKRARWAEIMEEKLILENAIRLEEERQLRETMEHRRKQRIMAKELEVCIRIQAQWKLLQKLIEAEEDRLIQECEAHRRRFSEMQRLERLEKAATLAKIRERLAKALELEEKQRLEKENLWISLGCIEKEESESRRRIEELKTVEEERRRRKADLEQQIEELKWKEELRQQERLYEQAMLVKQAALDAEIAKEEKQVEHLRQKLRQQEEKRILEERARHRQLEQEKERLELEKLQEELRLTDAIIAEERRKILQLHAPLLVGFLPASLFRSVEELENLSARSGEPLQRSILDDPDLW